MITLILGLIVAGFAIWVYCESELKFGGLVGILIWDTILVLLICFGIHGKISSTEITYEPLVSVNHYYVDNEGNVITNSNMRRTLDKYIVVKDSNLSKETVPMLKIIKENRDQTVWTFNDSDTYLYSVILNKE